MIRPEQGKGHPLLPASASCSGTSGTGEGRGFFSGRGTTLLQLQGSFQFARSGEALGLVQQGALPKQRGRLGASGGNKLQEAPSASRGRCESHSPKSSIFTSGPIVNCGRVGTAFSPECDAAGRRGGRGLCAGGGRGGTMRPSPSPQPRLFPSLKVLLLPPGTFLALPGP